ncbi:MAG: prepilin-type N-terminal cleavage/methylation domain-containing protein [Exiguobacterium sp.]|nr:prepilin-type N-terminal cleavage/methylation domain-containing protein [Exiguobacterium sp.]MDX5424249.1 prepilin-type N-terminal cleavage/methylation domain-containing protein [Exiguobacterium sp.]MDX6771768.1 prepilin-type N-terminal cleavage/methylation domain-containing protein [Exiguobacterium sp.]
MRRFKINSLRRTFRSFRDREDGVTLVELLLALVISAIFAGIVITVFLSGSLGFRLTNDTSSLRSEADYLITSVLQDINRTEFDALTVNGDTYSFHRLHAPRISTEGILYRQGDYMEDAVFELAPSSFVTDNPDVTVQAVTIDIQDEVTDARSGREAYIVSGLMEIQVTLASRDDATLTKTFTSTIPL